MTRARGLCAALAAGLALAVGCPAAAATPPAEIAAALAADPLYVDPEVTGALSAEEAGQLRERLGQADSPVYLAVLPAAGPQVGPQDDPPADLPGQVAAAAGKPGTYAVVAGTSFQATSDVTGVRAAELAGDALESVADGAGTATALLEFIDAVELAASQAAADALPPGTDGGTTGDDSGGRVGSLGVPWLVLAAGTGGFVVFTVRRARRR